CPARRAGTRSTPRVPPPDGSPRGWRRRRAGSVARTRRSRPWALGVQRARASRSRPKVTARRASGLQRFLLRRREEHVVENQPVARAVLVQRQVRRRASDRVLRVLGIMPAVVRPRALAVLPVDVLHPGRAFLEG